jgi:hypothetical protein
MLGEFGAADIVAEIKKINTCIGGKSRRYEFYRKI